MYANVKKIFLVVLDMIICGRLVCLAMHLLLEMSHNVGPSFAPLEPLPQKQPPVEKKRCNVVFDRHCIPPARVVALPLL